MIFLSARQCCQYDKVIVSSSSLSDNVEQCQVAANTRTNPTNLGCDSSCRLLQSTSTFAINYRHSTHQIFYPPLHGQERKLQRFHVQFKSWLNQLSLSHKSNKKQKKRRKKLFKKTNSIKICEIRPKRWERLRWEGFIEEVSFESGVEQRWSDAQWKWWWWRWCHINAMVYNVGWISARVELMSDLVGFHVAQT